MISKEHKEILDFNAGLASTHLNLNLSLFLKNPNQRKYNDLKLVIIQLSYDVDDIPLDVIGEYIGEKGSIIGDKRYRLKNGKRKKYKIQKIVDEILLQRTEKTKDTSTLKTVGDFDELGLIAVYQDKLITLAKEYSILKYRDKTAYTDVLRSLIYEDILT